MSPGVSKADDDEPVNPEASEEAEAGEEGGSALSKYATDLNRHAKDGKIDPLIGRDSEVERTIQILCRPVDWPRFGSRAHYSNSMSRC